MSEVDHSRPDQHSYFTNCPWKITFKLDTKEQVFVVLNHEVNIHNHLVNKEAYQSYAHVKSKKLNKCTAAKKLLDQ